MPAPIVIVHDDRDIAKQICDGFAAESFEIACFSDPIAALGALEHVERIELLITPVVFKSALVSGLTLGRMVRHQRHASHILFIGTADENRLAESVGDTLAMPAAVSDLIERAKSLGVTQPCAPVK